MPLNPKADAIRDRLLNEYLKAQADLDRRILALADTPSKAALRRQLQGLAADVRATMAELDTAARAWVSTDLVDVYAAGAEAPGFGFQWNQIHRGAVQVLAEDTFDDLLSATKFVRTDVKRFIRDAARQHVRGAILGGHTATAGGRSMAQALAARFGHLDLPAAVTYANGAKHSLGTYGEVVLRTKTAVAYTTGTLNQSRAAGVTYMECSDGGACGMSSHADSDKANGQVVPIEVAEAYPLAHPNCARSWGARPDITTPDAAKAADRFTDEERQRLAAEENARAETHTVTGRLTVAEKRRRASGRALARGRRRVAR